MVDRNVTPTSNGSTANASVEYEPREVTVTQRLLYILTQPPDVMAIVLGLVAIALNLLVLLALSQVRNRITCHVRFIISLALSDILVSSSVFLHIVNKVAQPSYQAGSGPYTPRLVSRCTFMIIKALNNSGLNITLLNLLLMALDHYIAIMKPLQYPVIVCKRKVIGVIVFTWTVSLFLGFSDFLSAIQEIGLWSPYGFNYCEVVWITMYQEEYTIFAIAPVCLGIMVYSYSCIYWKIHRRRAPGVQEPRRESRRSTKALVTTLFALGSFVIAWLPLCLFQVSLIILAYTNPDALRHKEYKLQLVDKYLYNLLVLNAIIDPIIYTVRIREVKVGLQRAFCGARCCLKNISGVYVDANHSMRRSSRPITSYILTTGILLKDTDV